MKITSLSSLYVVTLALGVCTTPSLAEPGFECFCPDEQVRSVFFHHGRISATGDDTRRDTQRVQLAPERLATVEVIRADESTTLSVVAGGRRQAWALPAGERLHLVRVLAARLNEDAQADLVVELSAQGNGLAADLSTVVMLLSGSEGFRSVAADTFNFEPQSFVALGPGSTVQWIQTSFVQVKGTDSKEHSFWVHRSWWIRDGGVELDEGFVPRIFQFTHRPNQKETQLLEESVKRDLLFKMASKPSRLPSLP